MCNFNKIFGVVLVIILGLSSLNLKTFAVENSEKQIKILVLSDRVEQANAKYFIYPQISELIASEVINRLNNDGTIKAPTLSDVKLQLRYPDLTRSSRTLLNNYRATYDIDYVALRKIAKYFDVTNVLFVTGAVDTTSDFLKPTWWSRLNVPGENVVKSEFKIYTYMALVDLNSEVVKWQNVYERNIEAPEFGLADLNYSPDAKQLVKVKKSSELIAKDAAYRVECVLTPLIALEKTPPTIHEFVKFHVNKKYDESIQNIKELKKKTAEKIKTIKENHNEKKEVVEAELLNDNVSEEGLLKEDENGVQLQNEKNIILKFVKPKKEEIVEDEQLNTKVHEVIEEKAIQIEKPKNTYDMELRPAIDTDNNILINPLNIIIPKM